MEKLTAREAYLKTEDLLKSYGEGDLHGGDPMQFIKNYAKMHVKAAIKECIESAPSGSSTDTVSYEDVVECLKDCYPDKLII